jgi:hypothetical protein
MAGQHPDEWVTITDPAVIAAIEARIAARVGPSPEGLEPITDPETIAAIKDRLAAVKRPPPGFLQELSAGLGNLKNLPKLVTEGLPAAGRAALARATDPTPTMGQELAAAAPWLPIVPAVQDIISRVGRVLGAPGAAVAELGPEQAKPLTETLTNLAVPGAVGVARGTLRSLRNAPGLPSPAAPGPLRPPPPSPGPIVSPAPIEPPGGLPPQPRAPSPLPSGRRVIAESEVPRIFGVELERPPTLPPPPALTPNPEIALRDYMAPGGTKVVQKIGDEVVTWTKTDRNEWQGWVAGAHRKLTGESALHLAAQPPAPVGR